MAAVLASFAAASCGDGLLSPPQAATLTISPPSATLSAIAETVRFTATILDQNGEPFGGTVRWSSSDESVFTVDPDGLVTALGNGSGILTASFESLSTEAALTVEQMATALEVVSGSGQEAIRAAVVRVADAGGSPVAGVTVIFTPAVNHGTASPESAPTDADGQAVTIWTLGPDVGTQTLTVSTPNGPRTDIVAEASLPRPDLETSKLPDAHVDIDYSAKLRATGGSGGGYSWDLAEGSSLPGGLTLATTGVIDGVARAVGIYDFVVRITDSAGGTGRAALRLRVCEGPLDLLVGMPHVVSPTSEANCGFALRAPEAGAYYRVTLVARSSAYRPPESVAVHVMGGGVSSENGTLAAVPSHTDRVLARSHSVGRALDDPHLERLVDDRRLLAWIRNRGGPHSLPDLRDMDPRDLPSETRGFRRGSPGSLADNCAVNETHTGELVGFNDHIAFYAEPGLAPALDPLHIALMVDYYGDHGAYVIDEYFGGVSDVDGDGRVTVFIDSQVQGPVALVWLGDLLSTDDCPASNQAELIRLNRSWVGVSTIHNMTGTVVHEAKHLSSHYQMILRAATAGDGPLDAFGEAHPPWIEEGTADIAKEISSRLAWEALGGPSPQDLVSGRILHMHNLITPSAYGVYAVLSRAKQALTANPHSVAHNPDPYGSGWHFHRFLGDWIGGAATARLGDARMFRELNDSGAPVGLQGIRSVTGHTFEELIVEYATAVSLAGTGAPVHDGVPNYTTYDFTGTDRDPFYDWPGRFPWPVTMSGDGSGAQLWLPLGTSTTLAGTVGHDGLRVHDFRANQVGEVGVFRVEAPPDARVIVVRIPDQSRAPGDGR